MVDFVEESPLRYALTFKPTICVSYIRQFWSTARIETTEKGTQILATVDGVLRTVTESSLRRNLKLQDEEGINSLPNTKLFENLTLMGYNISPNQKFTFQKGQFSHQWKFLIHTIMQCLSPKSTGFNEFSSNIATALVCLATNRTYNFSKIIFDGLVKNVNNKVLKFLMYPRQYTRRARIAQSSALPPIADEPASPVRDVSQGEACPTNSCFIADQDGATIAKSSTLPHDSAPREVEINRLKERVKILEDKGGVIGDRSGDDAPIKGRRIDEEEVATERVSSDTEEVRLDEGEVTAERAKVPTGSRFIPTAGPSAAKVPTGSDVVPTASPVFATATVVTPYRRRKGKEVMVESETPKKQKLQEQIDAQIARELKEQLEREDQRRAEQIARDAEIARIHAKEELQSMIDGLDSNNETVAKYLEEYRQFSSELHMERRIELISDLVKYQDNYTKVYKFQSSKEEAKRIKRKGINLEQESAKKQKSSEEITKEVKSSDEVPEEKIKEMMQLVPIEEVYVKSLQVKHPIIDWEVHTEGQRAYWKITRLRGSSVSYQFFTDLLKHLDRDDLNQLWSLVKEILSKRPATSDKEMEL
nr:synaptobrevin, longin-like domain protein [Tanacetum cinerariifolium]